MKQLFIVAILFTAFNAQAAWTESIVCDIARGSVDTLEVTNEVVTEKINISGPHNGEYGVSEIQSKLAPSYTITLDRVSSGRTESASLKTTLGNDVVAMSSTDMQQSKSIVNTFVTENGDYQFTVSCTSN